MITTYANQKNQKTIHPIDAESGVLYEIVDSERGLEGYNGNIVFITRPFADNTRKDMISLSKKDCVWMNLTKSNTLNLRRLESGEIVTIKQE